MSLDCQQLLVQIVEMNAQLLANSENVELCEKLSKNRHLCLVTLLTKAPETWLSEHKQDLEKLNTDIQDVESFFRKEKERIARQIIQRKKARKGAATYQKNAQSNSKF